MCFGTVDMYTIAAIESVLPRTKRAQRRVLIEKMTTTIAVVLYPSIITINPFNRHCLSFM